MTPLRNDTIRMEWVRRVRDNLRTHGYYYEPEFSAETDNAESLLSAARLLGTLFVPSGANPSQPVIRTQPSPVAPQWRPFDRHSPIRWHNDFSTRVGRPELSLSLIRQEDPAGLNKGAWWVASATAVLAQLCQTREGRRLATDLSTRAEPFGYRDAGGWHSFRVITGGEHRLGYKGLRFYGPALEEGAWLRFGRVPPRTREIVARVEEAADSVREVLPAMTGALLIVHNSLSLHDRAEQSVSVPKEQRRQACLCFVKRLHQPIL
jgi:hypothetical protein